eukprot:163430-Amphidinium_carterae.3
MKGLQGIRRTFNPRWHTPAHRLLLCEKSLYDKAQSGALHHDGEIEQPMQCDGEPAGHNDGEIEQPLQYNGEPTGHIDGEIEQPLQCDGEPTGDNDGEIEEPLQCDGEPTVHNDGETEQPLQCDGEPTGHNMCEVLHGQGLLEAAFGPALEKIVSERIGRIEGSLSESAVALAELLSSFGSDAGPAFMPNGLGIPGVCHMAHNTAKDVTCRMRYWPTYWQQLKIVEGVLTNADYMRAVIHESIETGPYAASASLFKKAPPKLYEARWSVIANFLHAAFPQLLVLRQVWHASITGSADATESVQEVKKTLDSNFFFAYTRMVMLLVAQIDEIPGWCEACSCHASPKALRRDGELLLVQDFHQSPYAGLPCPCGNMRLPELVAAILGLPHLGHGCAPNFTSAPNQERLCEELCMYANQAELEVILQDFQIASEVKAFELRLKLKYVTMLPWCLAGLAHHNEFIVQGVAKHCISTYDTMLAVNKACLPKYVHRFLQEDSAWRHEIDAISNGKATTAADATLLLAIASLRFIPISERVIEAGHSTVKKSHGYNSFGPVSASSHLRTLPNLIRPLMGTSGKEFFDAVVAMLSVARIPASAALALHVSRHPQVQAVLTEEGRQHSTILKILAKVVYRCDALSTFRDLRSTKRTQQQNVLLLEGEALKHLKAREPITMEALLAHHLTDFWRAQLAEGAIVALPQNLESLVPLDPDASKPTPCEVSLGKNFNKGWGGTETSALQGYVWCRILHCNPAKLRQFRLAKLMGGKLPERSIAVGVLVAGSEAEHVSLCWQAKEGAQNIYLLGGFSSHDLPALLNVSTPPLVWQTVHFQRSQDLTTQVGHTSFNLARADATQICKRATCNVTDMCVYECLVRMHEQHWTWSRLPSNRKTRLQLQPFRQNASKVVRSVGVMLCEAYLQCLLLCAEGHVSCVPHGLKEEVYKQILGGDDAEEIHTKLLAEGAAQTHPAGAGGELTFDGASDFEAAEGAQAAAASSDFAAAEGAQAAAALPSAGSLLDDGTQSNIMDRTLEEMLEEVIDDDVEHAQGNASDDVPQDHPIEPPTTVHDIPRRWGIFRFGLKRPNASLPHGALEAVCPLHLRNARSSCKKVFAFKADSATERDNTVMLAKHWCCQGLGVERQWQHVYEVPVQPVPPREDLEAQRVEEMPASWCVVDDDTYYGDAAPSRKRRRPEADAHAGRAKAVLSSCSHTFDPLFVALPHDDAQDGDERGQASRPASSHASAEPAAEATLAMLSMPVMMSLQFSFLCGGSARFHDALVPLFTPILTLCERLKFSRVQDEANKKQKRLLRWWMKPI